MSAYGTKGTSIWTITMSAYRGKSDTANLHPNVRHIARCNIDSGFDLAKSLAGAKNLAEVIELQAAYCRKQFDALGAQAEEVRSLSMQVTADAAKPARDQVTCGMDELRKAS